MRPSRQNHFYSIEKEASPRPLLFRTCPCWAELLSEVRYPGLQEFTTECNPSSHQDLGKEELEGRVM